MIKSKKSLRTLLLLISIFMTNTNLQSQNSSSGRHAIISPEITKGNQVTFRIAAPQATSVKLISSGSDIPNIMQGKDLAKGNDGVWSLTLDGILPGAYRYNFNVDGVSVLDPVNVNISESNTNSWSMFHLPGEKFMDTENVPHGAVSEVTYYSKSLQRNRRMHVYTPAGYESANNSYPVLYLLHGAYDSDDSWSTVGRAGFILDNLIATGKAVPMVVVMPKGHVAHFQVGQGLPTVDPFLDDFNNDIVLYIEANYRIKEGRLNHAVAGLSMGGWHTINIFTPNMQKFAYVGVFSSGVFGLRGLNSDEGSWESDNEKFLKEDSAKDGLKLFWFATGKDDFLFDISNNTVDLFRKYNFNVTYKVTEGGHTWKNWREYLNDFAPLLFKSDEN